MPSKFSNLKEARIYLEVVIRRSMHFKGSISQSSPYFRTTIPPLRLTDGSPAEEIAVTHLEELRAWHRAFLHPLRLARRPERAEHLIAATTLELHYSCSCFAVISLFFGPDTFAAPSTPAFKEIVSLSRTIVEHPDVRRADSKFVFDMHFVVALHRTGLQCRHSETRREAIALLLSSPRREGVWDSVWAGKTLTWLADTEEEEGLDGEFIYEDTKVVAIKYDFGLVARRVHVNCW